MSWIVCHLFVQPDAHVHPAVVLPNVKVEILVLYPVCIICMCEIEQTSKPNLSEMWNRTHKFKKLIEPAVPALRQLSLKATILASKLLS